jgi:hypothetical protein
VTGSRIETDALDAVANENNENKSVACNQKLRVQIILYSQISRGRRDGGGAIHNGPLGSYFNTMMLWLMMMVVVMMMMAMQMLAAIN